MLVALAVLAVLLGIAAPAFLDLIASNRLLSEAYALRATLSDARSEAMAQRTFVTLCHSADADGSSCGGAWEDGYIAFVDIDGDGVVDMDDGDEVVLRRVSGLTRVTIEYSNAKDRVRFDSRGGALDFGGVFTLCDKRGEKKARGVIVSNVGAVMAAMDTDEPEDDIVNDHEGNNVSCPE
jgi:type IV fimbrial biogenesis protein FimT